MFKYDKGFGTYDFNTKIIGQGQVTVGKYCSIAENVTFITWGHRTDRFTTYPFGSGKPENWWHNIEGHPVEKPILIGNDVWIGFGAIILPGTKIKDGAVIAAGSVVSGLVKPYSIVAGNPAQRLYYRFKPEIIKILLKLKWWDYPVEKIKENVHLLCTNDETKLIELYNKLTESEYSKFKVINIS